jgi:predicted Zn-dependent protease
LFLKYSRDAESEADLVGAQIMYDAGYNPYSMVEFFNLLEKEGGSGGPQFLSDHPNPGNRAENVARAIAKFPKHEYARQDSAAFRRMKEVADSMKAMTAQEAAQYAQRHAGGVNQGSIQPAGSFQRLDHNAFSIAYPSNWQVAGDQNSAVLIAPQGGAQQGAIAYGVLINAYRPQQAQSLDQATQELYQMLRQANPEISPAGNLQGININGIPARSVRLQSRSPLTTQDGQAVAETDWLVTVPRQDGTVLYMIFISPEQQWDQLAPAYEQMLQSLQVRS